MPLLYTDAWMPNMPPDAVIKNMETKMKCNASSECCSISLLKTMQVFCYPHYIFVDRRNKK